MRFFKRKCWAALCGAAVVVATTNASSGADEKLVGQGEFKRLAEPLAVIFDFKLEDGKLAFDRDAWKTAAEAIAQKEAEAAKFDPNKLPRGIKPNTPEALRYQARLLEEQARQLERTQRGGESPPLHFLFRKVQEAAVKGSRGFSGGGPSTSSSNGWRESHSMFRSDSLSGQLQTNNDGEMLSLAELGSSRALELVTSSEGSFRIQSSDSDGNSLLMHQAADGRFSVVVVRNGKVLAAADKSFTAFARRNREVLNQSIMPALAAVGVQPFLPLNDPQVQKIAVVILQKNAGAPIAAQKLFADLNSDNRATRDKARDLLSALYDDFKEPIEQKMQDTATPAEVRAALRRIVDAQREAKLARRTVDAFDLLKDPEFLTSLLDDADPQETVLIMRQLEALTGEKMGPDAEKWKAWVQANRPPAAISGEQTPPKLTDSELFTDGTLPGARKGLRKFFPFKTDGDRLVLDRAAWNSAKVEEEKDPFDDMLKNVTDPKQRAAMQAAHQMSKMHFDAGPKPAIMNVFAELQNSLGSSGGGSGRSGIGEDAIWDATFTANGLSGKVETSKKSDEFDLRETEGKRRLLEFRRIGEKGFKIQLTNPRGDVLSLAQDEDGTCNVVALIGDQVFADQQPSYGGLVKAHREWVEQELLPAMARIGFATSADEKVEEKKDAAN